MKAKIKDHYNQALVVLRKKYGVDAKSNVELQKICQELKLGKVPVVPWDQYKGEKRAIVNTDDHRKKGTHWVAVFKAGKTLFIYDSFARKSAHILRKFDEQWGAHYRIVDTEKIPDQQGYQSDCGLRCVTWLLMVKLFGVKSLIE